MKFFHLADLHIGKKVNGFSMLEDQRYIFNEILKLAREEAPDGVLIAGDIYDRPVPPEGALLLFDGFLKELSELGIRVFIISGNHDSEERLAFGRNLMEKSRVHISPAYDGHIEKVVLEDKYGKIALHMIPYLKPQQVRRWLFSDREGDYSGLTYNQAMKAVVEDMKVDSSMRNVCITHQFITGAQVCDSEEISIGGLDNIDASVFDSFDYVALGHLHGPQKMGRPEVRYAGTPLKYSFSEVRHRKSLTCVELREKGNVEIRTIPLVPLRDFQEIRGSYDEITDRNFYKDFNRENYMNITLTDTTEVYEAMGKLRTIYPNIMQLGYEMYEKAQSMETYEGTMEGEKLSPLEHIGRFFNYQNQKDMTEEQMKIVRDVAEEVWK